MWGWVGREPEPSAALWSPEYPASFRGGRDNLLGLISQTVCVSCRLFVSPVCYDLTRETRPTGETQPCPPRRPWLTPHNGRGPGPVWPAQAVCRPQAAPRGTRSLALPLPTVFGRGPGARTRSGFRTTGPRFPVRTHPNRSRRTGSPGEEGLAVRRPIPCLGGPTIWDVSGIFFPRHPQSPPGVAAHCGWWLAQDRQAHGPLG